MNLSFFTLRYLSLYNMTYHSSIVIDKTSQSHRGRHLTIPYINIPNELDWRDYGVVGPVHNQGSCNSCWAFSAAGSIEYHVRRKFPNGEIDVQSVLDCSKKTYGCDGGLMEHVFEYEHAFPIVFSYSGSKQKCHVTDEGAHVDSFIAVEENIENTLPYLLTKWGPVAVGVDFHDLSTYKGGIIKAKDCGQDPRHAVLIVGYTPSYWIIKNSLGLQWGDSGFALLERGTNACGIDNTYASVATKVSLF